MNEVKPTTKNSPKIVTGKNVNNLPAEAYAKPHTMTGKTVDVNTFQCDTKSSAASDVNMSVGAINRMGYPPVKTTGIKIRGTGAATKGVMARGPMG
jgi:hypothetical protein